MLKQLTIKNLAIIDDITIDFEENLNVLTGETGAGKSIIIDAISLVFGARANSEIVAHGKDSAFISAALYLNKQLCDYIYDNYDIDVSEECIITRNISLVGKSNCKINGIMVPLHVIQEISSMIIDISSQNESQYLFNAKNHLKLLDTFIESKNPNFKDTYLAKYEKYLKIKQEVDKLNKMQFDEQQVEFLNYKLNELKDFNYTVEDIYEINKEYKELMACSQNASLFEEIIDYVDNDHNGSVIQLYNALKQLAKISSSAKVNEFYEKFNSLYLDLSDLTDEFKRQFSNENIDLSRIDYLSDEITKINRLKRKYNVDDLLQYKNKLINEIELINNREIELSKLNKMLNECYNDALNEANKISLMREKFAKDLSNDVMGELVDLYLYDASFSINFEKHDTLTSEGIDKVEFYMSANKGVPERPLVKVASGGEVSRIMLGLKSVFTSLSNLDIIIFDEIDTGVSGKVASAMGKMMEKISKSSQVLAITHLPQVAARSDHHYFIYKVNENEKTKTIVEKLTMEQKIHEVARLLSGDEITDNFIKASKELISSK